MREPICDSCKKIASAVRVEGYKSKVGKYPWNFQQMAHVSAIKTLLIQQYGEEVYWEMVAKQIKEINE
jgi:hypothetical protein